jgi:hypothetical protein
METMGTIAAPLLGGFAFASIGLVIQVRSSLRWPDQALVLVVCSFLLFVTSVQATFNARRNFVPLDEWVAWLELAPAASRRSELRLHWLDYLTTYRRWVEIARLSYNLAIVALFAATAVLLVPHGSLGAWRAVAVGLAALGALAELGWVLIAQGARLRGVKFRDDSPPTDASELRPPRLRPSAPNDADASGDRQA